ncbi:TetR/AcrR family transcriptional regulator [Microbacterium sp. P02]|uniref:TetR/AcrR family transcriptional regulator n=1 Tax=Microbacterium sp. P02 TaxID=3366260 RepID=UPI00366ED83E
MTSPSRSGRPRASSRETLAEAACELFLEQGYESTSVLDITTRAGVSRSSFFNYFASKADILWATFDERLEAVLTALADTADPRGVLVALAADFEPDTLALGITQATAMGISDELERERAVRQGRLAQSIAARLRAGGADGLVADVGGASLSGALFAAIWRWAQDGAGRTDLRPILERALRAVAATSPELRAPG